jgi:hypothetical protein
MICARFLARSAYSQGAQGRRSSVSVSEGSSWRVYLPSGSLLVPHENRRSGVGPPSARALQNRWSRPRRDVRRISRSVPTRATFRVCSRAPERWSIGTGNGWRSEHTDAVLRVSDPVLPSMVTVPIGVRSVRGLLIERRRGGTTCAAWVASAAGTRAAAGKPYGTRRSRRLSSRAGTCSRWQSKMQATVRWSSRRIVSMRPL